jgi:hypothetical protein
MIAAAPERSEHDRRSARIERARHRQLVLVLGLGEIGERRRPVLRSGVVRDARRDQLRSEVRLVGVIRTGIEPGNVGLRIREQPSGFLQRFHRRGIREQQHVGFRSTAREFRRELAHDFRRARTKNLDFDAGIHFFECVHRLCGVTLGL